MTHGHRLSATIVRPEHVQAFAAGANIGDMALAVRSANVWLGMVKRDMLQVQCAVCRYEFVKLEPPAFFVCLKTEIATGAHVGTVVKPVCATCAEHEDDAILQWVIASGGGNPELWRPHQGLAIQGPT
jgi:hypothetical protein